MTRKEMAIKFEKVYGIKPSSTLTKRQIEQKLQNADMYKMQNQLFKDVIFKLYS